MNIKEELLDAVYEKESYFPSEMWERLGRVGIAVQESCDSPMILAVTTEYDEETQVAESEILCSAFDAFGSSSIWSAMEEADSLYIRYIPEKEYSWQREALIGLGVAVFVE